MITMSEPLPQLFRSSRRLVLDFTHMDPHTPRQENIAMYFNEMERQGKNPRSPRARQSFNDQLIERTGARYLVSSYAEDRIAMLRGSSIADEGRTLHLGIDIFSKDLEPAMAPCDGTIVRVGHEPEDHSFGYFLFIKPDDTSLPYIFMGHLGKTLPSLGHVKAGQSIARLGDFETGENGGWSRHLHLQLFQSLPKETDPLVGYASAGDTLAFTKYPDPMVYFTDWNIQQA